MSEQQEPNTPPKREGWATILVRFFAVIGFAVSAAFYEYIQGEKYLPHWWVLLPEAFMGIFGVALLDYINKSGLIKFIDVDKDKKTSREVSSYQILEELADIRRIVSHGSPDGAVEREPIGDSSTIRSGGAPLDPAPPVFTASSPFELYFSELRAVLEDKADVADRKASLLLDQGVAYTRFGIAYYLAVIIFWQVLSVVHGFHKEYLYGMVTTSLLFVFIEFLAAWYLKQYRHFVDTSTYLIKVKSMFDRYMLTYLAVCDDRIPKTTDKDRMKGLLAILAEEIRWPDTYLFKKADTGFAADSLDGLAKLVKAISAETKLVGDLGHRRSSRSNGHRSGEGHDNDHAEEED